MGIRPGVSFGREDFRVFAATPRASIGGAILARAIQAVALLIIAITAATITLAVAHGAESGPGVPVYDVDGECRAYAITAGPHAICGANELASFNAVAAGWPDIRPAIRSRCIQFVDQFRPPMKYVSLKNCLATNLAIRD